MNTMMAEIRELGRLPRFKGHDRAEYSLASRLREARHNRYLNESQLAELAEMPGFDVREEH